MQLQRHLGAPGPLAHAGSRRGLRVFARATAVVNRAAPNTRVKRSAKELQEWERTLLESLQSVKGRGVGGLSEDQQALLLQAIEVLEADGGVQNPTADGELDGKWRLLYTSRPGTASPIQRTFTGVDSFQVFQEVAVAPGQEGRVTNVVDFGNIGYLRVEAQASTESNPLEGFVPRQGEGLLPMLFGKSITNAPPARSNMRIDFQFDFAAFTFSFLPFKIPYPVPFRLLGDETKGWLDITYMSQDRSFRLSRGNKGTVFVLVKDFPLKEKLERAIEQGEDEQVLSLVELMAVQNPTRAPARSPLAAGTWRLVWSQQAKTASPLQKFGSKQARSFQIIGADGSLQNRVDLAPFLRISARARCEPASDTRTDVYIADAGLALGSEQQLFVPLPSPVTKVNKQAQAEGAATGWVDWLYLDEDLRITRGNKGSLFIHRREA